MATIRQWLNDYEVKDSDIEAVKFYGLEFGQEHFDGVPTTLLTHPEDWAKWFEIKFYSGYGCAQVPYFEIWTKDIIYYRYEYDGSTGLDSIPRNPGE